MKHYILYRDSNYYLVEVTQEEPRIQDLQHHSDPRKSYSRWMDKYNQHLQQAKDNPVAMFEDRDEVESLIYVKWRDSSPGKIPNMPEVLKGELIEIQESDFEIVERSRRIGGTGSATVYESFARIKPKEESEQDDDEDFTEMDIWEDYDEEEERLQQVEIKDSILNVGKSIGMPDLEITYSCSVEVGKSKWLNNKESVLLQEVIEKAIKSFIQHNLGINNA